MECTSIALESGTYCDNIEAETGGLKDFLTIWPHNSVQTYPTYIVDGAGAANSTLSERIITANSAFVMKTGKLPIKLPMILEKTSLSVTSEGTIFITELKVRIQDNTHNRGLCGELLKCRFSAAFTEDRLQITRLIGQCDGTSVAYLAMIKKGSYKEEIQESLTGEKFIEFIITARRYQPINYTFPIVY